MRINSSRQEDSSALEPLAGKSRVVGSMPKKHDRTVSGKANDNKNIHKSIPENPQRVKTVSSTQNGKNFINKNKMAIQAAKDKFTNKSVGNNKLPDKNRMRPVNHTKKSQKQLCRSKTTDVSGDKNKRRNQSLQEKPNKDKMDCTMIKVKLASGSKDIETIENIGGNSKQKPNENSMTNQSKEHECQIKEPRNKPVENELKNKSDDTELNQANNDTTQAIMTKSKLSNQKNIQTIEDSSSYQLSEKNSKPVSESKLFKEKEDLKTAKSVKTADRILCHTDSKLLKRNRDKIKPYNEHKKLNLENMEDFIEGHYKRKRVCQEESK